MLQMQLDKERLYTLIHEKLTACRDAKRMTQELLARRSGVARSSIANFESGRQRLPLHSLYQLCAALDIEVTSLLPTIIEVTQTASEQKASAHENLPAKTAESIEMLRRQLKIQHEG